MPPSRPSPPGGSAVRPVAGAERIFLVSERVDPTASVIQFVAEGDGDIQYAVLVEAVRRAGLASPGAAVRRRGVLGWTQWHATGQTPPVTVVDAPEWDGLSPVAAPFLERRLDVVSGSSCEVLLVRSARTYVIVRAHHASMDGVAAREFLFDIFRCVRGEEPLGAQAGPTTCANLVRNRTPPGARIEREKVPALTGSPEPGAAGQTWRRTTARIEGSNVLPRTIEALIDAAAMHSEGPWRLYVPVDLRRHQPGLTTSANLVGGLLLEGAITEFRRDAVRRQIEQQLEARRETRGVLALELLRWAPLGLMASLERRAGPRRAQAATHALSALVSNLNRHSLNRLDAPGWRPTGLFMIPPGSVDLPFFLSILGHEGGLELCAAAPNRLATGKRLEGVLGRVRDQLEQG